MKSRPARHWAPRSAEARLLGAVGCYRIMVEVVEPKICPNRRHSYRRQLRAEPRVLRNMWRKRWN